MFLTLGALAMLALGGYLGSVRIHPFRPCHWCSGLGKHRGTVFLYAHRPCRRCGGSGRRLRFGTRFVGGPN
jgi:DnaJ-class molecular chaperone